MAPTTRGTLLLIATLGIAACGSTVSVDKVPFGIKCSATTTSTTAGGCSCELAQAPNDLACDESSTTASTGNCCADEGWPQPDGRSSANFASSFACTCKPNPEPKTVVSITCDKSTVNGTTSSCICDTNSSSKEPFSSCALATGTKGVCCYQFPTAGSDYLQCTCETFATTCSADQTKVASCDAALLPKPTAQAPADCPSGTKHVTSCTKVPFVLDAGM